MSDRTRIAVTVNVPEILKIPRHGFLVLCRSILNFRRLDKLFEDATFRRSITAQQIYFI